MVFTLVRAAREQFGNLPPRYPAGSWPLQNPVLYTLIWIAVILLVFVPLATRQYKRAAAR